MNTKNEATEITNNNIMEEALLGIPKTGVSDTLHVGQDDLPWVDSGHGVSIQLLHVDLAQGLWINRSRFSPGITLPTHYHTGIVYAVTQKGKWWYTETPEQVNSEGSYLFEPAMSIHTLTVDPDTTEDTVAWFAIYGANVDLDEDGNVTSILDAATALKFYRQACAAEGKSCEGLIVVGEELTHHA